ncbi:hypothetical protein scyTo_0009365 [Scyliorhinus torazame]|uniref:Uncharacterized protein n=1 Tax=Scyliorhinus torazame TaxID=75743 RepID=A0A401NL31_SCYTO|nr:hypothetical protein [Scyliorhinus torazame]
MEIALHRPVEESFSNPEGLVLHPPLLYRNLDRPLSIAHRMLLLYYSYRLLFMYLEQVSELTKLFLIWEYFVLTPENTVRMNWPLREICRNMI